MDGGNRATASFSRQGKETEVMIKAVVLLLIVSLMVLTIVGCVQPRVGGTEYRDSHGWAMSGPKRHWWGKDRPERDVDIDRFLYRWQGLTD
jgi:hypothetical protein